MFYICCQIRYFIPVGVAILLKEGDLRLLRLFMCVHGCVCLKKK